MEALCAWAEFGGNGRVAFRPSCSPSELRGRKGSKVDVVVLDEWWVGIGGRDRLGPGDELKTCGRLGRRSV